MQTPRSFPNPWPHLIVGWFVLFASALTAWIVFAIRQPMDLVRPDYYEAEVHYQGHLDRLARSASIARDVGIEYDAARETLSLVLPVAAGSAPPTGTLQFYRPSDATLDFNVPLRIGPGGVQQIDVVGRRAGNWRVRVEWTAEGRGFFFEKIVVLADGADSGR